VGERDERRHLPTAPDEAEAAAVVQAVAAFVDDLVEELVEEEAADLDLNSEDDVAGGNGAP
jgi:hypothetical protein